MRRMLHVVLLAVIADNRGGGGKTGSIEAQGPDVPGLHDEGECRASITVHPVHSSAFPSRRRLWPAFGGRRLRHRVTLGCRSDCSRRRRRPSCAQLNAVTGADNGQRRLSQVERLDAESVTAVRRAGDRVASSRSVSSMHRPTSLLRTARRLRPRPARSIVAPNYRLGPFGFLRMRRSQPKAEWLAITDFSISARRSSGSATTSPRLAATRTT